VYLAPQQKRSRKDKKKREKKHKLAKERPRKNETADQLNQAYQKKKSGP